MSRRSDRRPPQAHSRTKPEIGAHKDVPRRSRPLATILVVAALIALTIAVFAPVRNYDFVELDDPAYVRENVHVTTGLTAENVHWAFTSQHAGYWIPLTWVSYMVDVELAGGAYPGAHHVTNLLLHLVNVVLLFLVFRRMTGALWASAIVAALFAVHPLHVESVAWITERKDVLSTLFLLLAIGAYVKAAGLSTRPRNDGSLRAGPSTRPSNDGSLRASGSWVGWHVTVLVLFACGLMAKPMVVTLPVVLLLLDWWPLGRHGWKRLVLEKLPLFAVSGVASVVVFVTQAQTGATMALDKAAPALRVGNALVSYASYILKMFWPANLAAFYSLPASLSAWHVGGALLLLAAISTVVIRLRRRCPYLAVGWLWYLITLAPVIGLVQVGLQSMADRFTYVPLVGLFIMVVWGVRDLVVAVASRLPAARQPVVTPFAARLIAGATAVASIVTLAVMARVQVGYWKDSVTMWTQATQITLGIDEFQAHVSLGRTLSDQGRHDEARQHLTEAVRLKPDAPDARYHLAVAFARQQRIDQAIVAFNDTLRLKPDYPRAHADLGAVLAASGRIPEALQHYQEALRLQPDLVDAHINAGTLLARQGRHAEALRHFTEAVRLAPTSDLARANRGLILLQTGSAAEALVELREALRLNPNNEAARRVLADLASGGVR